MQLILYQTYRAHTSRELGFGIKTAHIAPNTALTVSEHKLLNVLNFEGAERKLINTVLLKPFLFIFLYKSTGEHVKQAFVFIKPQKVYQIHEMDLIDNGLTITYQTGIHLSPVPH